METERITDQRNQATTSAVQASGELDRLLNREFTPTDVLLRGDAMDRLMRFSEYMAKASIALPTHFRGKPGDCLAISMQAALWKLDPFAVARKCYVTPEGAMSYEAQLVAAVIIARAPIKERPEYEFFGDWDRVIGKFSMEKSEKTGKYYPKAAWEKKDEEGLGVICRCTLQGESKPRELRILLKQCYPRFSTQWPTDPQQQITYRAITKWARRYTPDVILGIYSSDELQDIESFSPEPGRPETKKGEDTETKKPPIYDDDSFAEHMPEWQKAIDGRRRTPQQIVAMISGTYELTPEQKATILALKPTTKKPEEEKKVAAQEKDIGAPQISFELVKAKLTSATEIDVLDAHADLIGEIADPEQRKEAAKLYKERRAELEA